MSGGSISRVSIILFLQLFTFLGKKKLIELDGDIY